MTSTMNKKLTMAMGLLTASLAIAVTIADYFSFINLLL